jgi:import inner membrane translocase subunit TIM9
MRFFLLSPSYSMYNNLVERCFGQCVGSFRSKTLEKGEASCVENCSARYIKMTQRVGLRFAEHQAMQQKRATDAAAAAAGGR